MIQSTNNEYLEFVNAVAQLKKGNEISNMIRHNWLTSLTLFDNIITENIITEKIVRIISESLASNTRLCKIAKTVGSVREHH